MRDARKACARCVALAAEVKRLKAELAVRGKAAAPGKSPALLGAKPRDPDVPFATHGVHCRKLGCPCKEAR